MRYLIGFALLLPMVVFAKDPPPPKAALLNAKTAFIEKVGNADELFDSYCKASKVNGGAQDKNLDKYCKSLEKDAKADKQLLDKIFRELEKWGHFTLVQERNSADIIISLSRGKNPSVPSVPVPVPNMDSNEKKTIKVNASESIVYERGTKYLTVDGNKVANLGPDLFPDPPGRNVYPRPSWEVALISIRDGRNNDLLYWAYQTGGSGKLVSDLKKRMKQK